MKNALRFTVYKRLLRISLGQIAILIFLTGISYAEISFDQNILAEKDITVQGKVTSEEDGTALPGVNVLIQGTSVGTVTDIQGNYTIEVPDENSTLVFSFIGYVSQQVPIQGRSFIDITLVTDIKSLQEVVVVGYGTQEKATVTSAISTVEGEQLTKAPTADVSNSMVGRLPGLLSRQNSGEPGNDEAVLRIRGTGTLGNAGPLVIVDGIPRNFNQLSAYEIESITVLKDAAAIAPYGLGGANGVILVTTKRGKKGEISLNYNGWAGVQRPTSYPEYLDSYEFAKLLNVANVNVGLSPAYTEEEVQKFKDQSDPDHYPNHDWIKEVINFNAPITSHNLSLTGGAEKIRFFSSLGYLFQEGAVSTINYSRFNLAANVDVDATPTTVVSLDVKGSIERTQQPGATSGTGIFTTVTKWPPVRPLQFSNGQPGMELLPQIYESGYKNENDNIFYSQLGIEQRIPFIPGLSLKGVAAYDKGYTFGKNWITPFTYYVLNNQDEQEPLKGGTSLPMLDENFNQTQTITLQGYLTYKNTFGRHNLDALGVVEKRSGDRNAFSASRLGYVVGLDELSLGSTDKSNFDNSGSSSENVQMGLVYRLNYSYAYKYLLGFSGRYDGHYYFAPGERFAFFPAVSLGWRLSEENFIRNNFSWINDLKLRGSYGKSGNLAGGPFQYLSAYGLTDSYIFGGSQVQGINERREANRNITWETANKLDVGLEGVLWKGKLSFGMDFFWETRSDMLISPSEIVPAEYGIGISQINAGMMENRGMEFTLNTQHQFENGIGFNAGFNFTYARNKLIETFENDATYNNPERSRTGKPLGTQFGYRALGFFQSQEEIDGWAKQFGEVAPGDIKYDDVNGDGRINSADEVVIGKPEFPEMIFGMTTALSWKGFDLNMLWQGAGGTSILLRNEAAFPFFNGAKAMEEHLDYWTPENRDATNPRVTPSPTTNNRQESSFWIRDGSYVRLKTLELGYALPPVVMEKLKLNSIRVFVSGQNLLTFSEIKFFDPEISNPRGRYYFQQKVFSAGLSIGF